MGEAAFILVPPVNGMERLWSETSLINHLRCNVIVKIAFLLKLTYKLNVLYCIAIGRSILVIMGEAAFFLVPPVNGIDMLWSETSSINHLRCNAIVKLEKKTNFLFCLSVFFCLKVGCFIPPGWKWLNVCTESKKSEHLLLPFSSVNIEAKLPLAAQTD